MSADDVKIDYLVGVTVNTARCNRLQHLRRRFDGRFPPRLIRDYFDIFGVDG